MADIADYDKFDYDYSKYWEKREYENLAEKNILNKIFLAKRGRWFLDIGGSYGRLTSTYYQQYEHPVILDYSYKTLLRNKDIIKNKYPKTILIAANAYKTPFRTNVFDGALMIRVLHHIENPEKYLNELKRILRKNSIYIQEYANKIHIKARIKAFLKFDFSIFSKEPYKQPEADNLEGSQKGQGSIFYNYHPKYIRKLLAENNFTIKRKYGCSFLRSQFIKKIMNTNTILFFEKVMQNTLSWSNISPSIILETYLLKRVNKDLLDEKLEDILVCPSCKKDLIFENNMTAKCSKCSKVFMKKDDIWDFRVK